MVDHDRADASAGYSSPSKIRRSVANLSQDGSSRVIDNAVGDNATTLLGRYYERTTMCYLLSHDEVSNVG